MNIKEELEMLEKLAAAGYEIKYGNGLLQVGRVCARFYCGEVR